MTCRAFVEQDESEYQQERRSYCQKGAYVRVVGQLREYQGQKHLSVHDMRACKEGRWVGGWVDEWVRERRTRRFECATVS